MARVPTTMTETITNADMVAPICDAIRTGQRFLLTSHARPDGDSIGSQLAMAYALDALGKDVRLVNADAAPDRFRFLNALVQERQPEPQFVETYFLRRLSDLAARSGQTAPWPAATPSASMRRQAARRRCVRC